MKKNEKTPVIYGMTIIKDELPSLLTTCVCENEPLMLLDPKGDIPIDDFLCSPYAKSCVLYIKNCIEEKKTPLTEEKVTKAILQYMVDESMITIEEKEQWMNQWKMNK